jgi:hypothetical protein
VKNIAHSRCWAKRPLSFAGERTENILLLTESRDIHEDLLSKRSEINFEILDNLGPTRRYIGVLTDESCINLG